MVKPQEELEVESSSDVSVTSPSNEEDLDDNETTEEPEEDEDGKTTEDQQEETNQHQHQDKDSTTANNHLYEYEENPYATTQGTSSYRHTAQEFQDLGYEDAAPTPRRGSMFGDATGATGSRRDSLVERMINWAGQGGNGTPRRGTGEGGGGRRGSVDFMGGIPVARSEQQVTPRAAPSPKFRAPSIGNEELLFDEHGNPIPKSAARIKGHGSRRNSLQDMLDKAMAYVNLRPNFDQDADANDDLSPFGTRRDSLFNTT